MIIKEVHIVKTRFNDCYDVDIIFNENDYANLRVVLAIPTDKELLLKDSPSADIPTVEPYLLVTVNQADFLTKDDFKEFENTVENVLLQKFKREAITYSKCRFFYPSPAFNFE